MNGDRAVSLFRQNRDQPALSASTMVFDDDAGNHAQRAPVVMVMDNSYSMQGKPIDELNAALADMRDRLRNDVELSSKAEICLITFGHNGVTAWRGTEPAPPGESPFVPASRFEVPRLEAGGVTPMTEALELAMRLIAEEKRELRRRNLSYYRPVKWLVTDGEPTDDSGSPSDDWKRLPAIIAREEREKRFAFFAASVGNISPYGDEVLRALAPGSHYKLQGFDFSLVLQLVSASAESAAHDDPIEAIKARVMNEYKQRLVHPV
jgi:uncharacterized protein YegL